MSKPMNPAEMDPARVSGMTSDADKRKRLRVEKMRQERYRQSMRIGHSEGVSKLVKSKESLH